MKKIMVRNAFCWAVAIALPVIVMIVLDLFELHTPSRVALWGSLSILVPFNFANRYLGGELGRLIQNANDRA